MLVAAQSDAPAGRLRAASGHRALANSFEPDPALPSELPRGFYRLLSRDSERVGYPPFGRVFASDAHAADGAWSLAFALAGGAMAVVTEPALIPATAGEVFESSVQVLAEGVERSTTRLVLRALDAAHAPIAGAEWPMTIEGGPWWRTISVRTGAMPTGTRSLEVALEVRPRDAIDPTGDVRGAVAFDALEVWRIPRVSIEVDRGGAPIGAAPRGLIVTMSDPVGGASLRGRVLDSDGAEILSWPPTVESAFTIEVPTLPSGAYQVETVVRADGRTMTTTSRAMVVGEIAERRNSVDGALVRFGLWIERPGREQGDTLLQSVRLVRPSFVVINLDDPAPSVDGRMSLAELRRFVDDLRLEGVEPVLRLARLPAPLAARLHLEPHQPAAIFDRDDTAWRDAFGPWFEHFGHVVPRWMIARDATSAATTAESSETALSESSDAPSSAIARALGAEALVPGFIDLEAVVQVVDAAPDGWRQSADAAAREAIERWRGGARMVALRGAMSPEPGAAALAFGALSTASSGARSSADLDAGSELGCLLLSCEPRARVLVWRHDGGVARAFTLPFDGESMSAHDALGAPVLLERRQGAIAAEIGSSPVVIDGVDPVLGAFLATIRFEPPVLEGSTAEQTLTLRLTNPWNVTMEGTLRFVAPVEWGFIPRTKRFSLPPGSTAVVSSQTTLSRTQPTGAARVGVELDFTADRAYALRVDPRLDVEVRDLACEATIRPIRLVDGRPGAVIELLLTNRSERPLELESTIATTSGLAKRDGPIRLVPGAQARRLVRIDEPVLGAVIVTVSQTNGPLRLVRTLP